VIAAVEAHVSTTRAERYVEQLSSHFAHQPGGMKLVSSEPGELVIDLGEATWRIRAEQDGLVLRVEADPARLDEVSAHVGERIEQIGRRDDLSVSWQPADDGQPRA
jgi:uncharacterized protein